MGCWGAESSGLDVFVCDMVGADMVSNLPVNLHIDFHLATHPFKVDCTDHFALCLSHDLGACLCNTSGDLQVYILAGGWGGTIL